MGFLTKLLKPKSSKTNNNGGGGFKKKNAKKEQLARQISDQLQASATLENSSGSDDMSVYVDDLPKNRNITVPRIINNDPNHINLNHNHKDHINLTQSKNNQYNKIENKNHNLNNHHNKTETKKKKIIKASDDEITESDTINVDDIQLNSRLMRSFNHIENETRASREIDVDVEYNLKGVNDTIPRQINFVCAQQQQHQPQYYDEGDFGDEVSVMTMGSVGARSKSMTKSMSMSLSLSSKPKPKTPTKKQQRQQEKIASYVGSMNESPQPQQHQRKPGTSVRNSKKNVVIGGQTLLSGSFASREFAVEGGGGGVLPRTRSDPATTTSQQQLSSYQEEEDDKIPTPNHFSSSSSCVSRSSRGSSHYLQQKPKERNRLLKYQQQTVSAARATKVAEIKQRIKGYFRYVSRGTEENDVSVIST